ncbi:hypothetical protein PVK06_002507 [Gossypium arboreum]|uniref:Uncharacterized protein n=1 Tax=Gossypium arboreum TaxID=29729 RepID=A0ABR0R4W5_GOSAR|nr:hypothetical protein PVK06_002507 [Gossypium arboreum]
MRVQTPPKANAHIPLMGGCKLMYGRGVPGSVNHTLKAIAHGKLALDRAWEAMPLIVGAQDECPVQEPGGTPSLQPTFLLKAASKFILTRDPTGASHLTKWSLLLGTK